MSLLGRFGLSMKCSEGRNAYLALILLVLPVFSIANASLFKNVRFHQLQNGVRVVFDILPQSTLAAVGVCIRAGSKDEPENARGVAHLVEHLVFKRAGTNDSVGTQLDALSVIANAETSFDYTIFSCVLGRDKLHRALELMHRAILAAEFREDLAEIEKKIVKLELAQRSEDVLELAKALSQWLIFRSHPYACPYDGVRDVGQLTLAQALQFYRAKYLPQNMTVICSGYFDEQSVLRTIERTFGKFESPWIKTDFTTSVPDIAQITKKHLIFGVEKPFNAISMSFLAPGASEGESFVAGEVIANYIGDPNIGELAELLKRSAKPLRLPVIGFNVSFVPGRAKSAISINLLLRDTNFGDVEAKVLDLLNSVRENGINGNKLAKFKRLCELRFRKRCSSVLGRVATLAEAEGVATYRLAVDYIDFIYSLNEGKILRVARQIFNPDSYAVVVIRQKRK